MDPLSDYLWCVILGAFFCFTLGFGMGANDVSNNFGTSIGAKSISLKNAIIIAAIFELLGSVALGATVTDSVRKGVYDPEAFEGRIDLLLMANMVALISGTIWLLSASRMGLPVSTTHSLVGALLGCGLAQSTNAIKWSFVGTVVASWFLSPLLSSIVGIIYYVLVRRFILRSPNSVRRGQLSAGFLVWITCVVCSIFFMWSNPVRLSGTSCSQENAEGQVEVVSPCVIHKWVQVEPMWALLVAIGIGTGLTVIVAPLVYWRSRKELRDFDVRQEAAKAADDLAPIPLGTEHNAVSERSASVHSSVTSAGEKVQNKKASTSPTIASIDADEAVGGCKGKVGDMRKNMPWNQDLHEEAAQNDSKVTDMARHAEHFDPRCETFFKTLQIVSASLGCLLHGSNDVANAAAPYASVYDIYRQGKFNTSIQVPLWILVLGGLAISVGLTFLGHRVIRRVGIELLYVTPSRGFCIEIASSTIMLIGSFSGLPLSTTHVVVGSMLGVGLIDKKMETEEEKLAALEGGEIRKSERTWMGMNFAALNWKIVRQIATAWVGTLVICALLSFSIYSFVTHSPSVNQWYLEVPDDQVEVQSASFWDGPTSW